LYLRDTFLKQLFSLHKISVSLIAFFLFFPVSAGDPLFKICGAREAGMGNVMPFADSFWSLFQNQGLAASVRSVSAGVNYENRFFLSELSTRSVALAVPAGKATVAGLYSHFGYADYKREMVAVACGLPLSDRISAGIQIDYFNERTYGEYSAWHSVTCEAGIVIEATENLSVGIQVFNPVPNSIRKNELPSQLRLDISGRLSSSLCAGAGIEMSTGGIPCLSTGMEYNIYERLSVRGGFRSEYTSFSFGVGYMIGNAVMDIAFYSHEKLGISSAISLIFKLKKK
jgi:hypothetical protein